MAEVFQYRAGLPSFSEVLEIISRWSSRSGLSEADRDQARSELAGCLEALEQKTDGMSGIVRERIGNLLKGLGG